MVHNDFLDTQIVSLCGKPSSIATTTSLFDNVIGSGLHFLSNSYTCFLIVLLFYPIVVLYLRVALFYLIIVLFYLIVALSNITTMSSKYDCQ